MQVLHAAAVGACAARLRGGRRGHALAARAQRRRHVGPPAGVHLRRWVEVGGAAEQAYFRRWVGGRGCRACLITRVAQLRIYRHPEALALSNLHYAPAPAPASTPAAAQPAQQLYHQTPLPDALPPSPCCFVPRAEPLTAHAPLRSTTRLRPGDAVPRRNCWRLRNLHWRRLRLRNPPPWVLALEPLCARVHVSHAACSRTDAVTVLVSVHMRLVLIDSFILHLCALSQVLIPSFL